MGSCLGDRKIRGDLEGVYNAYKDIIEIDTAAGHYVNRKKLAMTATTVKGRQDLKSLNMGTEAGLVTPRIFLSEKVVGDMICTKKAPARAASEARMNYSIDASQRVEVLQCQRAQKARAVATTVIPKMLKGTQWTFPAETSLKRLRSFILCSIWIFGAIPCFWWPSAASVIKVMIPRRRFLAGSPADGERPSSSIERDLRCVVV